MYASEKEKEQAAWGLWSKMYPLMAAGFIKHMSLEDFRKEGFKKVTNQPLKSADEIEAEMMQVIATYEKRK